MIILNEPQVKTLKETVERLLKEKLTVIIPLQSRYKARVDASKKVYLAKGKRRNYVVILSQEKYERMALYQKKGLAAFYPRIYADTEILLGEKLYLSVEEFIIGKNASAYLLNKSIPLAKRKKMFQNIIRFPIFKNKTIGTKIPRASLVSEIQSLVSNFSFYFRIEEPDRKRIDSSMKMLIGKLPRAFFVRRLVNFDFIADNIVITSPMKFRVIDLEHQKESLLGFIEPFRFLKYLCFDLYQSTNQKEGPEVIYRYENPYFLLTSSETELSELRTILFQTLHFHESHLSQLLLLEFMIDCMIQKDHGNIKLDTSSFDYVKHVVKLLLCDDPSKQVFMATEYLTKSFDTYDQLLLQKILSSKFYKLWMKYQKAKEKILRG